MSALAHTRRGGVPIDADPADVYTDEGRRADDESHPYDMMSASATLALQAPPATAQRNVEADLRGQIVSAAGGEPIEGAWIALEDREFGTHSRRGGRFLLAGMGGSPRRYSVEALGHLPATVSLGSPVVGGRRRAGRRRGAPTRLERSARPPGGNDETEPGCRSRGHVLFARVRHRGPADQSRRPGRQEVLSTSDGRRGSPPRRRSATTGWRSTGARRASTRRSSSGRWPRKTRTRFDGSCARSGLPARLRPERVVRALTPTQFVASAATTLVSSANGTMVPWMGTMRSTCRPRLWMFSSRLAA